MKPLPQGDLLKHGANVGPIEEETHDATNVSRTEEDVCDIAERPLALPGPKPRPRVDDDFDWSPGRNDSVVIPSQPAIAVFFNPLGEVVIRQESQLHPDEDHFIYVRPSNLRTLINSLIDLDKEGD